ncbi:Siderophore iron transporter [Wickerhamomyces ciferrii]|uniref:Siderophore iron transporter n=1 Tax=Wickerhamomyces ciferrii (strain ATCC 14091 / BCRC 22168 / CBS 111 / JCM 3599 / NBRC 0793 / NRRL Y-1031 F-60-10) TaxID=1206466 RepID=K0KXV0_WICCF|nr:Siderophore iron transporter [Wickerhamomyces ciferrii]CCH46887.1 Siderophore iron transporter [Wickerhamomyces ciferrii]
MSTKKVVEDNVHELNPVHSDDVELKQNSLSDKDAISKDDEEDIDDSILDSYAHTKSIVIKKTEILFKQCDSKLQKAILFFSCFLIGYGYGLDSNIRYVYTGYASSDYGQHSLIATVGVINAVVGAASQMALARLSDVFGRLEILIASVVLYAAGTVIQSQAYDIQRFCAGSIFYNLGYVGVILIVTIIISDFSSLRWRTFYKCSVTLPFVINTWISGDVSSAVGPDKNWSWGIGMWAIIFPVASLPLIFVILHMRLKAGKTPEWKALKRQKTHYQSKGLWSFLKELYWRTDITGILILTVMLGCILVPLTLAGGAKSKWAKGEIIGPLVLGVVLIPIFGLYESYIARYPLAAYKLVKDRGVWSAMCIQFLLYFIGTMYKGYLYTVLIIAMNQSVKSATRINILPSFVSVVGTPFFGVVVAYVRRLKMFILSGISLYMVGLGLMYHFRGYEYSKNGVIGGLVVIGLGMCLYTGSVSLTVQASTSHEHMASVISLLLTVFRIGSAVASAVSGAVWTNLLPGRLEKDFEQYGNATLAKFAYKSPYKFVKEYKYGSDIRNSLIESYRYIQKMEVLIALVFCAVMLGCAFALRDPELTDEQAQNDLKDGEYIDAKTNDPIARVFLKWREGRKKEKAQAEGSL